MTQAAACRRTGWSSIRRIGAAALLACGWTVALVAQAPPAPSSAQPRTYVTHSTAQSIASKISTALNFDTDEINVGGMHSASKNNTRLTVPTGAAGTYLLHCAALFGPSSAGTQRALSLQLNGSTVIRESFAEFSGGHYLTIIVERFYALNDGDYVECIAFQDSGKNLDVGATSTNGNMFFAAKL